MWLTNEVLEVRFDGVNLCVLNSLLYYSEELYFLTKIRPHTPRASMAAVSTVFPPSVFKSF
jgi:hypothetical protein